MRIYNTMSRQKEEFVPLQEGKVGIYSCGPTVYNYFHIGNARPFIIFDTLRRYLEYRGYDVTFVQNFTDIDDKMIKRANEEGTTVAELAQRFIGEYYTDADALGIERATHAPHATEHIAEIITTVEKLIANGKAYEVNGDVYYAARSFPGYGKLSGQNMDELELGARVAVEDVKRDPMDFALWKAQKPGEPAWQSPWGMGRPGWHIECSAMSMKYLGDTFDIHCGGQDLIFPHHENEIAQSEGATGQPFARYWMHNGYINVDNRKMSKSLGNFFTVREIADEFDLMAVRLFMLNAHYRNPVNFSRKLIEQANNALTRIRNCHDALTRASATGVSEQAADEADLLASLPAYRQRFIDAMDDDLNTADALGSIFDLVRDANTVYCQQGGSAAGAAQTLALAEELLSVLGLDASPVENALPEDILALAGSRAQARSDKNWAESDRLRDELKSLGYTVEDTKEGQVVKRIQMNCVTETQ